MTILKFKGGSIIHLITGLVLSTVLVNCAHIQSSTPTDPGISPPVDNTPSVPLSDSTSTPSQTPVYENGDDTMAALRICTWQEPTSLYYFNISSLPGLTNSLYPMNPVNILIASLVYDELLPFYRPIIDPEYIIESITTSIVATQVVEGDNCFPCGWSPYEGDPVMMFQEIKEYRIRPDVFWSDGVRVTADDSVFAYNLYNSPCSIKGDAGYITDSYIKVDDLTVKWIGAPGYHPDNDLVTFSFPLPQHAWVGIADCDLFHDANSLLPLIGYGPYWVSEWQAGERLVMLPNAHYSGNLEDLFGPGSIEFVFSDSPDQAEEYFAAGVCDVLGVEEMNITWLRQQIQE